ncbi:MAG: hypothetical protein J0M04_18450 [Verrucomicrobia bacterium]|nr:hypothetical protein [Verrucomicrobiota bacterium]
MPRTLYSPRLSDDVVRALYREGQRRRMPMTRLADELIRSSLALSSQPAAIRPFDPDERERTGAASAA